MALEAYPTHQRVGEARSLSDTKRRRQLRQRRDSLIRLTNIGQPMTKLTITSRGPIVARPIGGRSLSPNGGSFASSLAS